MTVEILGTGLLILAWPVSCMWVRCRRARFIREVNKWRAAQ